MQWLSGRVSEKFPESGMFCPGGRNDMGRFVWDGRNGMFCPGWQNYVTWDILSMVANLCRMFCLGWQKTAWDVLSRVANLCGMFCPRWQKNAWDVLSGSLLPMYD